MLERMILLTRKELSFQRGENIAKLSSFAAAMIGLTKGVVGLFTGSTALLAQAVDSFTDVFASVAVYLGLKFTQKKPTEKFPYGYYRAETFASLIVAIIIILSGLEIARESTMRFLQPEAVSFPYVAMSVAAISIPFLFFLAKYNKKIGEDINSQAIVGQAKNFTLDVYSSMLVFLGVLSSYLGIPWIEALVAVIISAFILKTGASIGKDSVLALMDAVLKPEHISKLRRLSEEVPGVIGVHDIKIRKSGPFCFGEMHMEVEEDLPLERAHAIAEEVERKAKQECEELETLVIHMEPAKRKKFRIAVPIEEDRGLESTPNPHFGSASNFIIIEIDQGQIKNWTVKPNPGAKLSKKRGITSADFLIAERVNTVLAGELGEGPFHVLRDGLVEVYNLPSNSGIGEATEDFLNGKLEKVVSPKKTTE